MTDACVSNSVRLEDQDRQEIDRADVVLDRGDAYGGDAIVERALIGLALLGQESLVRQRCFDFTERAEHDRAILRDSRLLFGRRDLDVRAQRASFVDRHRGADGGVHEPRIEMQQRKQLVGQPASVERE